MVSAGASATWLSRSLAEAIGQEPQFPPHRLYHGSWALKRIISKAKILVGDLDDPASDTHPSDHMLLAQIWASFAPFALGGGEADSIYLVA